MGPLAVAIPLVVSVVGTVMSVSAQMQAASAAKEQGVAQQQEANYQAQQAQQQASLVQGEAEQKADQDQLKTQYIISTQAADSSANGSGGVTDPSTANLMSKTAARGQYQSLNDIWSGQAEATGLENQSQAEVYQGQQEAEAGNLSASAKQLGAVGTLFSNSGSLYSKYAAGTSPSDSSSDSALYGTYADG